MDATATTVVAKGAALPLLPLIPEGQTLTDQFTRIKAALARRGR